jgi:hypothetical protein
MMPPDETKALITYLTDFLSHVSLPKYDKPMDFIGYELPPPIKQ